MKNSIIRSLAASLVACSASVIAAEPPPGKPNILVIVSDDHGYADVGFHGCKDIPTPNLDRLAAGGLRCTRGYVSHPFCSPTRAGLMTGRYQQRFGHENNPFYNPEDHREGLPVSEKLLPAFLKDAGYITGWIGKWHLGAAPEFRPTVRGFSETFGFIGGGHRYLDWKPNIKNEYLVPIERNGKPVDVAEHLTTAFGTEAADFVRRHSAAPWFLYLAFNAPHTPHEPTPERLARFASIPDQKRRKYAAQVSLMDDAIGATLEALKASGQEQRTLVFFFSDNGGPIGASGNGSINDPLRGGKGTLYEGGVRVPFVISWPGKLSSGKTYDQPVCSLDVFATTLAAAGIAMPSDRKYDSVDLMPYLTGENTKPPHYRLFWRSGAQSAALEGDRKLVRPPKATPAFYHLDKDPGESGPGAEPPADLTSALDAWNRELAKPAFPGLAGRNQSKKPQQPNTKAAFPNP